MDIEVEYEDFCYEFATIFFTNDEKIVNEINPIKDMYFKVKSEEFCLTDDEEITHEMNPGEKMDIKVESKEFCLTNDDQGNYYGVMWMIIYYDCIKLSGYSSGVENQ